VLASLAARLQRADADADLLILTLAGCVLRRFADDPATDAAMRHRLVAAAFGDLPGLRDALLRAAAPLSPPVRERAAALAEALR